MKRMVAGFVLLAATLVLSGCYVAPGYGYVRQNGVQGPAYYGQAGGGYAVAPLYGGYYDGYYGGYGYYGCCYAPRVWVGGTWQRGAYRPYRGRGDAWRNQAWRSRAPGVNRGWNGVRNDSRARPAAPRWNGGRRDGVRRPASRRDGNHQ